MKRKKVLTNGYSLTRSRKEILLGHLNPIHNKDRLNEKIQIRTKAFICKCGRSIYEHPSMIIGDHYTSMPYHGDLCPYVTIGEMK